jgi:hypothetical protein
MELPFSENYVGKKTSNDEQLIENSKECVGEQHKEQSINNSEISVVELINQTDKPQRWRSIIINANVMKHTTKYNEATKIGNLTTIMNTKRYDNCYMILGTKMIKDKSDGIWSLTN